MDITVYNTTSGQISGRYTRPDVFDTLPLLGEGEDFIPGWYDFRTQYVDVVEKVVVDMPPQPSDWAVFDYDTKTWNDEGSREAELKSLREVAEMSRTDFLLVAINAGLILPTDAGPAARGEIPPSLAPVFTSLPTDVQIEAVVRWGAATVIERMNPVLLILAEAMQISDEQLDALFNIQPSLE